MEISWLQAIILGIFACLASMPGLGGTSIGNYTLGRPLRRILSSVYVRFYEITSIFIREPSITFIPSVNSI